MCSIFGLIGAPDGGGDRRIAVRQSNLLAHRGPDACGIAQLGPCLIAHNRISVVDVFTGGQPLWHPEGHSAVVANAEIYNHAALRQEFADYPFQTRSDCEVILPIVMTGSAESLNRLRGMFAFIAVYDGGRRYCIARDHMGILSLYYGYDSRGALYVASEMKALVDVCDRLWVFPPGCYMTEGMPHPAPYHSPAWARGDLARRVPVTAAQVRRQVEEAVEAHLMADVDLGFLLSGGLDSSLVASIGARMLRSRGVDRPRSYSIGLQDSPDLAAARDVAAFLDLDHREFVFTVEEGLDALEKTIFHLESFDVTSVRASVPMYLLSRRIRGNGTKVVLTGDGADESFAGYLYFHRAPTPAALQSECIRKLQSMHLYDCLRANKTMLAWGVEPRVPFLDRHLLDFVMQIEPRQKMPTPSRMEKHLLREAFIGELPESVLWRQKEQSSDGVGYGWIDGLKAHAEMRISDADFQSAARRFPVNTPGTREAFLYRVIFDELFRHGDASRCVPAGTFAGNATAEAASWLGKELLKDPSGRAVTSVHRAPLNG